MRRHTWALVAMLPLLTGFDTSRAREALDLAFHNRYGSDVLVAVELWVAADKVDLRTNTLRVGAIHYSNTNTDTL